MSQELPQTTWRYCYDQKIHAFQDQGCMCHKRVDIRGSKIVEFARNGEPMIDGIKSHILTGKKWNQVKCKDCEDEVVEFWHSRSMEVEAVAKDN